MASEDKDWIMASEDEVQSEHVASDGLNIPDSVDERTSISNAAVEDKTTESLEISELEGTEPRSDSNASVKKQTTPAQKMEIIRKPGSSKHLFKSPNKINVMKNKWFAGEVSSVVQTMSLATETLKTVKAAYEKKEMRYAANDGKDQYTLFGEQITMKMRALDKHVRPIVEFKVNQIFFEAETGQ